MQTAQPPASHGSSAGSLRGRGKTTAGSLLFKRVVRAVLMVVGNVLSQQSAKVTLVEDDGVIEQFATHASDPALCDTVLPRARSGEHLSGGEGCRVEIRPTTCGSAASKRKAFPVDCRARYPHGGQRFQHVLHHEARPTQIDVSLGDI